MAPMTRKSRLAQTFAAAALCTVYTAPHKEPEAFSLPPRAAPAISYMTDGEGKFICNFTMVGRNAALTAEHCIDDPATTQFSAPDGTGRTPFTQTRILYFPSAAHLVPLDPAASPALRTDTLYKYVANDKALSHLNDPIGAASGTLPIAPLDTLTWWPVPHQPGYKMADVFIIAYWAGDDIKKDHTLYKHPCHIVRFNNMNEMVAHNCPNVPGVSGSPIVTQTGPEEYAVVAVHHGWVWKDKTPPSSEDILGSALYALFSERRTGLASGAWSVTSLCPPSACRIEYNDKGHARIEFTPAP